LRRLAQFRAIESRRAFVRNAEDGYSGIIDGNGMLIAEPPEIDFRSPVVLGRMPIDSRFSLYALLGDWLPLAACVVMFAVVVSSLRGRQKGSSKAD
jgi:apolipoprotein N-acyltransferase